MEASNSSNPNRFQGVRTLPNDGDPRSVVQLAIDHANSDRLVAIKYIRRHGVIFPINRGRNINRDI